MIPLEAHHHSRRNNHSHLYLGRKNFCGMAPED